MKVRKYFVIIVFFFLSLPIFGWLFLRTKYVPPILMYHKIDYNYMQSKLSVSPESFERQMRLLSKKYKVLPLEKMVKLIAEGKREKKVVAITFDDGYENNYLYAYPILLKYEIPATIFVTVNYIGKQSYLSWDQIKEMQNSGLIEIGSHTINHVNLKELSLKELRKEIFESKKILEARLGNKIKFISYPGGAFDERVKKMVKLAGYQAGFTTDPGEKFPNDDIFALKRVRISRSSDNLLVFRIYTSGYYTWIKEMRDED